MADTAYTLFEKKYSIEEITAMPYWKLIELLEREQKFQDALNKNNLGKNK